MNELTDICGLEQAQLDTMSLSELRIACRDIVQSFELPGAELYLLIAAAACGLVVPIVHRAILNAKHKEANPNADPLYSGGAIAWRAIQGLIYGGLGAWAGLAGGLYIAELVGPMVIAAIAFLLAGVALLLSIVGPINQRGPGWARAIGVVVLCGLGGLLIWGGVAAVSLGDAEGADIAAGYESMLNGCAIVMGVVGAFTGIVGGDYSVYAYGAGLLTVPIGVTWGFLGTVCGVFMHLGAWIMGEDFGKFDAASENTFFHNYEDAPVFKRPHAFSLGPVSSATHHMWHEAVHVLQHFIFGPIFFLSYFGWILVAGLIGALFGWISAIRRSDWQAWADAIEGVAYASNPWEVWAYKKPLKGSSDSRDYLTHNDWVMNETGAWIVAVVYWLAVIGLFVTWAVLVSQGEV